MEALLTLLKDPATGNSALLVLVILMLIHQGHIRRLFERADDQEARLSRLEGEHNAARALHDCPMDGLSETMRHCPLVKRTRTSAPAHGGEARARDEH